tara:strand:+ start:6389 stop:7177 length:789 start_codon:yes stop_codon:yes gene_type:complete
MLNLLFSKNVTVKKLWTVIFFVVATSHVHASDGKECLEFHVIDNAPIGYTNLDNESVGVHWEYLIALEEETGLCINKKRLPYLRIWESIKFGKHDGGIMFKSDSRSNYVIKVGLIRTVKTVVIPVNGIDINEYNDLYGLRIGKVRGTHLNTQFDQDNNLNILALNHYNQATKMIKLARIDAIAGSALVLSYQFNKYNALDNVNYKNQLTLGEKEQWLQLSKKSKHLDKIPLLKKAIDKLRQDGTFNRIMDKYYGEYWRAINH